MPDSLAVIGADVRACRLCKLSQTRTVGVPGEGSPNAEIMFIGEGPGFHEDQQGRPFVGAAGQLLTEMLQLIGLRREDVFITNVVRCRPPGNRDPLPDELAACDTYTLRQVEVLKPKLIVTLGPFFHGALLRARADARAARPLARLERHHLPGDVSPGGDPADADRGDAAHLRRRLSKDSACCSPRRASGTHRR